MYHNHSLERTEDAARFPLDFTQGYAPHRAGELIRYPALV